MEYCTEQLLVHLDDPSVEIQLSVFDALCATICFDQSAAVTVAKKVADVRASHRDPSLCDQLLVKALAHKNV